MSDLLEKIRSRGFWRVVIRPASFDEARITDFATLENIVRTNAVGIRGWDFPHIDHNKNITRSVMWVGQESEWHHYLESWRLYKSGQFRIFRAFWEDWMEQARLPGIQFRPAPGEYLSVESAVYSMCEICEFAARLALSNAGDAEICMEIGVHGIQNRQLWVDETRRTGFSVPRESEIPVYSVERQISREQLVGTAQEHGLEEAQKLFALFGWDVGKDVLRDTLRQ